MISVSVIMATHNSEHDIPLAVTSILLQDYADFELVTVNDASTDTTPEILEVFASRDSRVILLHNDESLGRALSRNRAIEIARGDLIAILDADDVAMPHRLGRQVAYMQDHPEVGMLGSWAIAIGAHNQPLELLLRPTRDADIRRQLQWLNMPFVHSTMMFRRDVVISAGMYDPRFVASEDFYLCHRVVQKVRAASLPEFLTLYRIHASPSSEFVRTRYKWAARAGWDILRRHPSIIGSLSFIRLSLLSLLPGAMSKSFSSIYKDEWNQRLLSEEQKSEVQSWIMRL